VEDEELVLVLALEVDVEEEWVFPLAASPVEVVEPAVVRVLEPEVDFEGDAVVEVDGNRLAGSLTFAQERSYNGVVLKVLSLELLPMTPKLGFGAVGAASCRTYHQVLTLPKADAHPISSQKVFALATLAIPRFSALPLTGHPVSVIQTGLPLPAAAVALYAAQKRV